MHIKTAKFVVSNQEVSYCPKSNIPEYAFIGRSNVGKSSLINMLTNQKSLAKTSSRPGKTQLINHFLINENWHLVDLPGYGYAKVSRFKKNIFQKFITNYFKERKQLICAFVLIDIRHEPLKIDLDFMTWLAKNLIAFSIIFTKSDKLKPKVINYNIDIYKQKLNEDWEVLPDFFITSSSKHLGREEILQHISQINHSLTLKK
ncbi:MAG: ribosome biogenesis GTP-binding protein YihA/YsxC [Flavobacteriaceae bacterium]|jgi:GTP-binding protein|nr:ribosome biogenesis GTP-binding protein YihA/YsxC [Flavobacteriaceae bacterium]